MTDDRSAPVALTAPLPGADGAEGDAARDAGPPLVAPLRRVAGEAEQIADQEAAPDPDAARVIAKVRRLMVVSMAITIIAVGSVFGLVGYRMFKGEGTTAKTADKLPPSSPIPTDVTLSLPRGSRVIQSAVSNERLLITIEVDGKPEVRTFDVRTLQPISRLDFSATP